MDDLLSPPSEVVPGKPVNSHDIKLAIQRSRGAGYQTFFEVGNDTGTRVTRHADAVSIGIWPSTGHQIHGFEVKVSRTDFLNEMKDPAKSQAIFRFCHRWSLATPPGLVKVDELPPNWGLVTYDGSSFRTVKQPPLLTPEPLTAGFVAALVRRAGEQDAALINAAVQKAVLDERAKHKAEFDRRASQHRDRSSAEGQDAIKIVAAFKEKLGVDDLAAYEVADIAQAVKAIRKSGLTGNYQSVERLCRELGEAHQRIRNAYEAAGFEIAAARGAKG